MSSTSRDGSTPFRDTKNQGQILGPFYYVLCLLCPAEVVDRAPGDHWFQRGLLAIGWVKAPEGWTCPACFKTVETQHARESVKKLIERGRL